MITLRLITTSISQIHTNNNMNYTYVMINSSISVTTYIMFIYL